MPESVTHRSSALAKSSERPMDYGEGYTSSFMMTFRGWGRVANLDACYLVKTKTGSKYQKEELANATTSCLG